MNGGQLPAAKVLCLLTYDPAGGPIVRNPQARVGAQRLSVLRKVTQS